MCVFWFWTHTETHTAGEMTQQVRTLAVLAVLGPRTHMYSSQLLVLLAPKRCHTFLLTSVGTCMYLVHLCADKALSCTHNIQNLICVCIYINKELYFSSWKSNNNTHKPLYLVYNLLRGRYLKQLWEISFPLMFSRGLNETLNSNNIDHFSNVC